MLRKRPWTWNECKKRVTDKRSGKNRNNGDDKQPEFLTVQRLSAVVEGKCQKYSRIGPLTMVRMNAGDDMTLENIKIACKQHFGMTDRMDCDILAGERGPSYDDIGQIKDFKLLHVRFIEKRVELEEYSFPPPRAFLMKNKMRRTVEDESANSNSKSSYGTGIPSGAAGVTDPQIGEAQCAKSISLSEMIALGKLIPPDKSNETITVQLEEFCIDSKSWLCPVEVQFAVSKKPFASGAFRGAYHASPLSFLPRGKYVLKKQKEERLPDIEKLFESEEVHTRKSVQMNALANHFALLLKKEAPEEFGNTFAYITSYLGKVVGGQYVTIETYIEGKFTKYINNNGTIVDFQESEAVKKAETYSHFSYVKSSKTLMVLDIQGVGFTLTDPEIASSSLTDTENNIMFCSGNLSTIAIDTFLENHICNKYCNLVNIAHNN